MLIVDEVTVEVGPPLFSTSEELQRRKIVEGAAPCAFGPWTILAPWSLSPMDCFNGGFFSFRIVQGGGPEDRIFIRQDRTTAEGILLRETNLVKKRKFFNAPTQQTPQHALSTAGSSEPPSTPGANFLVPPSPSTQQAPRISMGESLTSPNALLLRRRLSSVLLLAVPPPKRKGKVQRIGWDMLETCLQVGSTQLMSPLSSRRGSRYLGNEEEILCFCGVDSPPLKQTAPLRASASAPSRFRTAIRDQVRQSTLAFGALIRKSRRVSPCETIQEASYNVIRGEDGFVLGEAKATATEFTIRFAPPMLNNPSNHWHRHCQSAACMPLRM